MKPTEWIVFWCSFAFAVFVVLPVIFWIVLGLYWGIKSTWEETFGQQTAATATSSDAADTDKAHAAATSFCKTKGFDSGLTVAPTSFDVGTSSPLSIICEYNIPNPNQ